VWLPVVGTSIDNHNYFLSLLQNWWWCSAASRHNFFSCRRAWACPQSRKTQQYLCDNNQTTPHWFSRVTPSVFLL